MNTCKCMDIDIHVCRPASRHKHTHRKTRAESMSTLLQNHESLQVYSWVESVFVQVVQAERDAQSRALDLSSLSILSKICRYPSESIQ